jgi:hypothetical protein
MNKASEELLLTYYRNLTVIDQDEYTQGTIAGIMDTLNILGIKIEGVNA